MNVSNSPSLCFPHVALWSPRDSRLNAEKCLRSTKCLLEALEKHPIQSPYLRNCLDVTDHITIPRMPEQQPPRQTSVSPETWFKWNWTMRRVWYGRQLTFSIYSERRLWNFRNGQRRSSFHNFILPFVTGLCNIWEESKKGVLQLRRGEVHQQAIMAYLNSGTPSATTYRLEKDATDLCSCKIVTH